MIAGDSPRIAIQNSTGSLTEAVPHTGAPAISGSFNLVRGGGDPPLEAGREGVEHLLIERVSISQPLRA
jgi:hypothetical protein